MSTSFRKKKTNPVDSDYGEAFEIFLCLQERVPSRNRERVELILDLLGSLGGDVDKIGRSQVLARLRNVLRQYQWVTHVAPTADGYRAIRTAATGNNLTRGDLWEYRAVGILLGIIPHLCGTPRVRRCAECGEWFFAAKKANQKFCNGNCKQLQYDRDPEKREQHRAAMRRLYALKKKLATNPKSGVGLQAKRKAGTR